MGIGDPLKSEAYLTQVEQAAPKMLEALRAVATYFWDPDCGPGGLQESDVEELVRGACAAAEGRCRAPSAEFADAAHAVQQEVNRAAAAERELAKVRQERNAAEAECKCLRAELRAARERAARREEERDEARFERLRAGTKADINSQATSDLLEVLREVVDRFDPIFGSGETIGPGLSEAEAATLQRARAAIARSEGRQP
jgi:hypothetical protein